MALKPLLSIAAIYMALVGLGFIFAPQAIGVGAVPPAHFTEPQAIVRAVPELSLVRIISIRAHLFAAPKLVKVSVVTFTSCESSTTEPAE